ncbi:MAG: DUF4249 family protein [Bacteroidia bacterium]
MKKSSYITLLFFTCIFLNACKKDATAPAFVDQPIIESYLEVGSPATVKVSKLISFDPSAQYATDDVNTLNMKIVSNGITYTLTPTGNGNYVDSSLIISDTATYALNFIYNGKVVSASTKALSKPVAYTQSVTTLNIQQVGGTTGYTYANTTPPDPVTMTWANPDHSYYIITVENIETNPEAINLDASADQLARIFRNEPTQDGTAEIMSRQFQYFGMHKITLYHILPEYADLYKDNGTSSQNLTSPSVAITNGVGIFTAINPAVLYINVHKL